MKPHIITSFWFILQDLALFATSKVWALGILESEPMGPLLSCLSCWWHLFLCMQSMLPDTCKTTHAHPKWLLSMHAWIVLGIVSVAKTEHIQSVSIIQWLWPYRVDESIPLEWLELINKWTLFYEGSGIDTGSFYTQPLFHKGLILSIRYTHTHSF